MKQQGTLPVHHRSSVIAFGLSHVSELLQKLEKEGPALLASLSPVNRETVRRMQEEERARYVLCEQVLEEWQTQPAPLPSQVTEGSLVGVRNHEKDEMQDFWYLIDHRISQSHAVQFAYQNHVIELSNGCFTFRDEGLNGLRVGDVLHVSGDGRAISDHRFEIIAIG